MTIAIGAFGEVLEVEEVFLEMARRVFEAFERWAATQPESTALFADLAALERVLDAGIRLQMVPVGQVQEAHAAACRLALVAQRATEVEYHWTLVTLFECLATAWATV